MSAVVETSRTDAVVDAAAIFAPGSGAYFNWEGIHVSAHEKANESALIDSFLSLPASTGYHIYTVVPMGQQ